MELNHQVIWTNVAENDLKEIIEYIALDRPQAALKIFNTIKDKVSDLYTLPERGRVVPELQNQGILQYRELIISPWRLIYRILDQKIFVLSLIDSRQNVEDILLKRMIR
ncbi:MAG: type II toxin-antitoxin system RelE/ParE family toxin [Desulfobacula sp.]|jgi:toxin ParE1/3/4|nr:type II toxin-antitoxin system RelE/ParE family toxin [Desulfobacula sp.]